MLRAIVLLLGGALVVTGITLLVVGPKPAALYPLGAGALIILSTLFERRYRSGERTQGRWQPTGERFVDPQSGEAMDVQYDPVSGARRYVRSSASTLDSDLTKP